MRNIIECTAPELRAAISTVAIEVPDLAADLDLHPDSVQTRLLEVLGATCSQDTLHYINDTGKAFPETTAEILATTALTKAERYVHIENGINHQHPLLVHGTGEATHFQTSLRKESAEPSLGIRFVEDLQQQYAATAAQVERHSWFGPSQRRYARLGTIVQHTFLPFNQAAPPVTHGLGIALSGGELPISTVGLINFVRMHETIGQPPLHRPIKAAHDLGYLGLRQATANLRRTVGIYDLSSLQGTIALLPEQDRYVYQPPRPQQQDGESDTDYQERKQLALDTEKIIFNRYVHDDEDPQFAAWFGPTLRCPVHREQRLQDQIHAAINAAVDYGLFDCPPAAITLLGESNQ